MVLEMEIQVVMTSAMVALSQAVAVVSQMPLELWRRTLRRRVLFDGGAVNKWQRGDIELDSRGPKKPWCP